MLHLFGFILFYPRMITDSDYLEACLPVFNFSQLKVSIKIMPYPLYFHPRRPRGKIIGRKEDKTAVLVGAKVYFSCAESTTFRTKLSAQLK